ncbi:MAG TPA: D-glycerate dehydrogenase [Gemmatimonadales bacterium]|nr:D-glycerate dehydrogenase [Gemmatimonadales bacterium]
MTKPIVVLTRRLPEEVERAAADRFEVRRNPDDHRLTVAELQEALRSADGIICTLGDPLREALKGGPWRTKILANFGAGTDHIDLAAAKAAGIVVTNTPGALTDATADLTMALILMVTRRLGEGERELRAGQWTGWRPTHLLGSSLQGKTLGIVGFGRIGQAVARRAALGFGMQVVYAKRKALKVLEALSGVEAHPLELDELLQVSDVVSLHTPATPETKDLINAVRIASMKPGSYLINTARGSVVDEAALIAALKSGHLAGAGLDVYPREPEITPELLTLPNVVALPHLGSATVETRTTMGMRAIANLDAFLSGGALLDPVK